MKKISLAMLFTISLFVLNACTAQNVAVVQPTSPSTAPVAISSEITAPPLDEQPQALAPKTTVQKPATKTITPVKTTTTKPAVAPIVAPIIAPKNASVSIQNFAFSAPTVRIKKGARVTWTNLDSAPHTATSDAGTFTSATLAKGASYSFTFNTVGNFPYYCKLHPSMKGTIIVE